MLEEINRPMPLGTLLCPATPFLQMRKNRALLGQLVKRNILSRFQHSLLGALWLLIPPLCILLLYMFVFNVVFKMRWPDIKVNSPWAFGLVIFCGMTVYSVFSEGVMGSAGVIASYQNYVKRVCFPVELLPVSQVLASLIINSLVLCLMLAVALVTGNCGITTFYLAPLFLVPLFLLAMGCAWFVAALGVFHRDIGNVLTIVLMILYFTAPIFYSGALVPKEYAFVLAVNPLTPIVEAARNTLLFDRWPDFRALAYSWLYTGVIFQAGYFCFMKWKRGFADVL